MKEKGGWSTTGAGRGQGRWVVEETDGKRILDVEIFVCDELT